MSNGQNALLIDRLLQEIAEIDRRITELTAEKEVLNRFLVKARREDVAGKEAARKDSGGRILIEQTILRKLERSPNRACSNNMLWEAALFVDSKLKKSTFRSHLFRLKNKGLIVSSSLGKWTVAPAKRDRLGAVQE
jgi:DNA-binding transcriptional ArsR family regulator